MGIYFGIVCGKEHRIEILDSGDLVIDGKPQSPRVEELGHGRYSVLVNGRSVSISVSGTGADRTFLVNGKLIPASVESERMRLLRKLTAGSGEQRGALEIRAPMPALVSSVRVGVGDTVATGQGLVILEAMKMENEIKSHRDGVVAKILISNGKSVEKGELLIVLEGNKENIDKRESS